MIIKIYEIMTVKFFEIPSQVRGAIIVVKTGLLSGGLSDMVELKSF